MMSPEQQKIYDALNNIGESLANFYLDAVNMTSPDCTILSKANMIAHAAREIDGGLRDIFAPDKIKQKNEAITSEFEKDSGYFASILTAVGKTDPQNLLANKWFGIAKNFHRIAHRKHIHGSSVDPAEILMLWTEYEKVLTIVIGSFLSITNRLDVLLSLDEPQHSSFPAIKNILRNPRNANYFFSNLDKVKWLDPLITNGYFDPLSSQINAQESSAPDYWIPLKYLINISSIARRNVKTKVIRIIETLMDLFIDGSIELHHYTITDIVQIIINIEDFSFGKRELNFFEKFSQDRNLNPWTLVNAKLSDEFAEKLIKKKDKEGVKNLLKYFIGFYTYEEPSISFFGEEPQPSIQKQPNVDSSYQTDFLHRNGKSITELLGIDTFRITMQTLKDLVKLGSHNLTHGSPASIEPSSQTVYSYGWEEKLVYFIRDFAMHIKIEDLDILLDEMLESKVQILQRLAIHLIRVKFDVFKIKWWKFIDNSESQEKIYIHEPYLLLKEYSQDFTFKEFAKAIRWIEKINPTDNSSDEDSAGKYSSYKIRRWLTALNPTIQKSKALLKEKEDHYQKLNNAQMIDHPEFDSYGTSSIGYDYPIILSDFQTFSIAEQIEYINSFIPEHPFYSSEEGLGETLRAAVCADSPKYLISLDEFISLDSLYVSRIVDGLADALKKDNLPDFTVVLNFIEAKLIDTSFKEESPKKFHYKQWFASSVSEFLNIVIDKYEQLKFTKETFEKMNSLIISMINNETFQDNSSETQNGYENHILNSVPGRLYMTLMHLTRLWADRFTEASELVKWPNIIKTHFSTLLSSVLNKDKEFSIILGQELPLLIYVDRKWVEDHLDEIFDTSNSNHYNYRIHTLFSRYYRISGQAYGFLKEKGIFTKALAHFKEESSSLDTLMIYALFEWKFWKGDPENGSIIAEIFSNKKPEHIKRLIHASWEQQILSDKELIYLWEKCSPELSTNSTILLWLFERLTTLTEKVFSLVVEVLEKASTGRDIYAFLRHLHAISNTNIELTGKMILLTYSKKLATPSFEHDLNDLVKKLYDSGYKDLADSICTQVGEMGSLMLKELFNKNN